MVVFKLFGIGFQCICCLTRKEEVIYIDHLERAGESSMRNGLRDYQAHDLLGKNAVICVPHVSSDFLPGNCATHFKST